MSTQNHLKSVEDYYSKVLSTNKDLKTTACCSAEVLPDEIKPIVSQVHDEVKAKFYGCGVPLPQNLKGKTVLDLGSGSGRDAFVLSKLVGQEGRVIGIDMTDEQLEVANRHVDYHMEKWGYKIPNVDFRKGFIEDLAACDIADNSIDLVVSNCVFNLSPEKERLYAEVFRVLKPGGELYFSDVFVNRRLPKEVQVDPVILGECLGGAQYTEDFRRMMAKVGCADVRIVNQEPIEVTNTELRNQIGNAAFTSITHRAFKLDLEDRCEDYGQVAYYQGTIPGAPLYFDLDDHHRFETGRPLAVCSNSAAMVAETRFGEHFKIVGDLSTHYGLFDCGPDASAPAPAVDGGVAGGACC